MCSVCVWQQFFADLGQQVSEIIALSQQGAIWDVDSISSTPLVLLPGVAPSQMKEILKILRQVASLSDQQFSKERRFAALPYLLVALCSSCLAAGVSTDCKPWRGRKRLRTLAATSA